MTSEPQNRTDPVQRQFGRAAAAYATSAVHAAGPDLKELVGAAQLSGRERVLDLGCGAGHTAMATAAGAAHVCAVDMTAEMLAVASALVAQRQIANISFCRADATLLPFGNSTFEVVTSRFSAHHYADPARALAEVARVLKPGGRFLLVDSVAPEEPALDTFLNAVDLLRDGSHVRNYRISEWQRMLAEAGLRSSVLFQMMLALPGDDWVQRIQTPAPLVAAIRSLFEAATPAARAMFAIQNTESWSWRIPVALLLATQS